MPSDVPGVRRNEVASGWMASLRATGVYRACFTHWRLAQRNAANTRQVVQSALARRPPHTGSAPVRIQAVEHGCSSRGSGEGHSPPCLKAGALWPQNGRRRAPDQLDDVGMFASVQCGRTDGYPDRGNEQHDRPEQGDGRDDHEQEGERERDEGATIANASAQSGRTAPTTMAHTWLCHELSGK